MLPQLAVAVLATSCAMATHLKDDRLQSVYDRMREISEYSWENGTKAQAILEYTYPSLSVMSVNGQPFPSAGSINNGQIPQIIDIAQTTMQNRPTASSSARGGASLLEDGAAADPASLGITIMLANASAGNVQFKGVGYGDAATAELNYLLYDVPRFTNGAISHRTEQAQLWSDFIFMVPPFLAYYGAMTNNQTLGQIAYDQISAYRSVLRQSSGLWAHIMEGTGTSDPGRWATGNGWAAYGMLRVYATIQKSSFGSGMGGQLNDLRSWADEILSAATPYVTSQGLLHNYIDDPTSFQETAGSALVAAAGIRMATLGLTTSHIPTSLTLLSSVSNHVNSTGYLDNVTNPLDFSKPGTTSPEGQSFVIMAYAAYKDWLAAGSPGGNGSSNPLGADNTSRATALSTSVAVIAISTVLSIVGVAALAL